MKIGSYIFIFAAVLAILALGSCQKTGGKLDNNEQTLVVETTPLANGHVEAPAPGPDFPLVIKITSTMPPSGVKIDVTAKPDGGTVAFFTSSATTTAATTNLIITGATAGVVAVVDITVTSVSNSSNKFTGSYKFSRK